jgi:hypothetical protein
MVTQHFLFETCAAYGYAARDRRFNRSNRGTGPSRSLNSAASPAEEAISGQNFWGGVVRHRGDLQERGDPACRMDRITGVRSMPAK